VTHHVTRRLHTGALYLINYVTSEGNWLHQILFRGFIAKWVNTYALFFVTFFETSSILNFTSPIWTIWCMSVTLNTNKNPFKLQVVMQQIWKSAKGDEYFCKALYVVVSPGC
jgi:hypothetical protein